MLPVGHLPTASSEEHPRGSRQTRRPWDSGSTGYSAIFREDVTFSISGTTRHRATNEARSVFPTASAHFQGSKGDPFKHPLAPPCAASHTVTDEE